MKAHAKHMNIVHQCNVCKRTFKDPAYLRQHRRGVHGRGWTAMCGARVDWPPKLHRHQQKCKDCKEIKEKTGKPKGNYKRKTKKKTERLKIIYIVLNNW